jgi:hypothetical protein
MGNLGSVYPAFIHDFHTGGRFSMKAPSPSFASSYPIFSLMTPCTTRQSQSLHALTRPAPPDTFRTHVLRPGKWLEAHDTCKQRHEPCEK